MINVGKTGEDLACKYLQKHGYKIVDRNYRIRGGEIDIVALDGKTIVYIEVKTRTSHLYGLPQESVTPWKMKLLERAAKFYRNSHKNLPDLERIDVLAIDLINARPEFYLIKNASF